jgi:cytochrome c1
MHQEAIADAKGSAIDPDTVCIGCGQDSNPETLEICNTCEKGFHTACFGMPTVPDADTWHSLDCNSLQQLEALKA